MARRILVATDFSTRSDRALRRGILLARQASAELILIHVIDDDQPRRLIELQEQAVSALLQELALTVRDGDGIPCETRVSLGCPFEEIVRAAEELGADLTVIGPHRRQVLRDNFLGTTAERTIREIRSPVIMANGVPAGPYRSVLIATDFSECSARAAETAKALGLLEQANVLVLHVLDTPGEGPIVRAAMSLREWENRLAEEYERASQELERFTRKAGLVAARQVAELSEESTAMAVEKCAKTANADLVVLGTHGRTGLEKWMLGSVAESVLRTADMDVLAIPPAGRVTRD
jgi:nucleotide-binding universal stress UspA family protein